MYSPVCIYEYMFTYLLYMYVSNFIDSCISIKAYGFSAVSKNSLPFTEPENAEMRSKALPLNLF